MESLYTLGRQPALGLAELESLFGAERVRPVGNQAAIVTAEPSAALFGRLGGSTRVCKVLTTIPSNKWETIEAYLAKTIPEHLQYVPEGKFKLGISYIGNNQGAKGLSASGLRLKKLIKATGRSVRIVPNKTAELNSAQIIHNQLTGPTGWELVLVANGHQTVLAQTVVVQDIEAYGARDQNRPKRDARVGMLPPKLAQIITNLAVGHTPPSSDVTVLDPFCGTGVVLQEAALMGFATAGTDLEQRMIEYSQANLEWLLDRFPSRVSPPRYLQVGDATEHIWDEFTTVACETYLGRPLNSLPAPDKLATIISDCDTIHRKFLQNLAVQTTPGFRACIAVPAWKTRTGFKHLKTLDNLPALGYNRMRFVHVSNEDLMYHRPDQVVARELVILQRT